MNDHERPPLSDNDLHRFWSKVEKTNGCWMWLGEKTSGRRGVYGVFPYTVDGKRYRRYAHRLAREILVEPVPIGLTVDHLCRQTLCVNPDHTEPVTQATNLLRGETMNALHARKTECVQGHQYTHENTMINSRGHRECRTCKTIRNRNRSRKLSKELEQEVAA